MHLGEIIIDGVGGNESASRLVGRVADLKRSIDVEDRGSTAGTQRGRVEIELVAEGVVFTFDETLDVRAGSSLLQLS